METMDLKMWLQICSTMLCKTFWIIFTRKLKLTWPQWKTSLLFPKYNKFFQLLSRGLKQISNKISKISSRIIRRRTSSNTHLRLIGLACAKVGKQIGCSKSTGFKVFGSIWTIGSVEKKRRCCRPKKLLKRGKQAVSRAARQLRRVVCVINIHLCQTSRPPYKMLKNSNHTAKE